MALRLRLTPWKFFSPPRSSATPCGAARSPRRATTMARSPLQQAIVAAGSLAASLAGRARRKPSEVTLDPKTAECAQEISNALAMVKEPTDPEMVKDVVQALAAFAKMRVLHTEVLRVFRELPADAWQDMPSDMVVEAVSSYAQFQIEDLEFNRFLADLIASRSWRNLRDYQLANLAFAAATLELGPEANLYSCFEAAFSKANVSRMSSFDLCRSLWSLARLRQGGSVTPVTPSAKALVTALEAANGKIFGLSLAQALWALPRLGLAEHMEGLLKVSGSVIVPGVSLKEQAEQLEAMASGCENIGLQAAVLNAAALRYVQAQDMEKCDQVLKVMAEKDLWTPVSYCLAERVKSTVTGSPAFPGIRNPGPRAHKYVRALYHALSRAKPNDISSALKGLEHFSRTSKKNWLKFGAADEKGQVLEDAWAAKTKDGCLALEFGTFLGYSAVKIYRQLGPGAKVISFEMDPEVACLALNFIEFAGLSDAIEVRIGQCEELVEELKEELDPGSVDVVYMDHNQMTYHKDLAQLQRSKLLSRDVLFAATQGLKPGAPLLLWQLTQGHQAGVWSQLDIVSCPDCGFRRMEDWVVLAHGNAAKTRSLKRRESPQTFPPAPREVLLLAAECNLMRWRTAKGMVDEKRWDEFVQYVRRGMEKVGIKSTKDVIQGEPNSSVIHLCAGQIVSDWCGRTVKDIHSGYGFAIGNVAAFDMGLPEAVVSPGGVGFDINCGVRLVRTNLLFSDVLPVKETLAQSLFDHIPVGVGSMGIIPTKEQDLEEALQIGIDYSLREGYAWPEDKEHCEEYGRMLNADPGKVSSRAKKRGLPQLGTLGAGNHYAEIQVVDEIYDEFVAKKMGIDQKGQVCVMIHSGSRGLGHQVATDALVDMERAMTRDNIRTNDRQLACARIHSDEGQHYLKAMSAAANYAWVNRSSMTFLTRQAFAKVFNQSPEDLDMHVIYDVSHNIAKVEEHFVDGTCKQLLVHRKGSTRAFPPHHPLIPVDYQLTGQPVIVGGTMGTCSYVLTGTDKGMRETFGSTCHGAGRALSRNKSRNNLDYGDVLKRLEDMGISIRVASPKLIMEEAPESYKDVTQVVQTCHDAGISKKAIKLKPVAVVKG